MSSVKPPVEAVKLCEFIEQLQKQGRAESVRQKQEIVQEYVDDETLLADARTAIEQGRRSAIAAEV